MFNLAVIVSAPVLRQRGGPGDRRRYENREKSSTNEQFRYNLQLATLAFGLCIRVTMLAYFLEPLSLRLMVELVAPQPNESN
jgi:hypothetical protein